VCTEIVFPVQVSIPAGYFGLLTLRSSMTGELLSQPGIIDSDYRGQLKHRVWNLSTALVTIAAGARVCQMVIIPYKKIKPRRVSKFSTTTVRGAGGFGSTGK
jgi:dUTP pyrophosphatase